ncbi:hypothetical protein F3J12_16255 [Burkholderia sp. Ax-1735]|nr:hypothetical protein [Burkholderia sp. Ap-955]NIF11056.1 hypothetical protein [Burkholderia sp. Ax-1735]NIG06097.1 hypothetical protein [Burkholderia sp. Tr-849]
MRRLATPRPNSPRHRSPSSARRSAGAASFRTTDSPFAPRFFAPPHHPAHDFFRLGGPTRTSSSAVISGHLNRTVPSRPDLRRTPARQGFAVFVTGSATARGTR